MEARRKKKTVIGLTMASLIDVVFLLLIFFMLSSEFVRERAIDVDLPESGVAETVNKENAVVYLKNDGSVDFLGKNVGLAGLEHAIKEYFAEKGNSGVTVKAHRKSALDEVVAVLHPSDSRAACNIPPGADVFLFSCVHSK